jgi:hypothetical protein
VDGDADQLEREVADCKAELAAEVERLRRRAVGVRESAARKGTAAAVAMAAGIGALGLRRLWR